jgi:ABC-type multidrug transport system ATPase subunit
VQVELVTKEEICIDYMLKIKIFLKGKTTLLNILNFRNRGRLHINGQVKVNGKLINSIAEIASISGYVQQDDLFIGSLTVKEHLIFQSMLRMDTKFRKSERLDRVEQVMIDVNI